MKTEFTEDLDVSVIEEGGDEGGKFREVRFKGKKTAQNYNFINLNHFNFIDPDKKYEVVFREKKVEKSKVIADKDEDVKKTSSALGQEPAKPEK